MDLEKADEVYPMMLKSWLRRDELPQLPIEWVLVPVSDRVPVETLGWELDWGRWLPLKYRCGYWIEHSSPQLQDGNKLLTFNNPHSYLGPSVLFLWGGLRGGGEIKATGRVLPIIISCHSHQSGEMALANAPLPITKLSIVPCGKSNISYTNTHMYIYMSVYMYIGKYTKLTWVCQKHFRETMWMHGQTFL